MKVYRFGEEPIVCYNIIIMENNGEIRISTVGLNTVREYIATVVKYGSGVERLNYGSGSSMPYKDVNGDLCEKYTLIYED